MKKIFTGRSLYISIAAVTVTLALLMIHGVGKTDTTEQITTTVKIGSVRELVSVSGIAEAEQTAELAFPIGGIVSEVIAKIGDVVESGDTLIKLDTRALYADRQEAVAAVTRAIADRDELISGPTASARDVTNETLAAKQESLETTIENEERKVENAYLALVSSNLTAYSNDIDEDATPPIISGTYNCSIEGEYLLEMYSSNADSGYSYRLSGIESGTFAASSEQPSTLGDCGLRAIFSEDSKYNRSEWIIEIPNTKSSQYIINRNAYALAITQADSAISNAEQAVTLAEASATDKNTSARSEEVIRADAAIEQARARVNKIDANIADKILRAPFTGTITEIDILPGETVTTAPVITLLASSEFEVTARIPEIDIGKLIIGQQAEMVFDAKDDEVITGEISFISLKATEIDGVSYYEAIIELYEVPAWIRSGLNSDIEIVITEQANSLRIPNRFLNTTETGYETIVLNQGILTHTPVEVTFEGNSGYVAITGLNEGDIIVAP